jgi:chaperone modulatory protein CbpM
MKTMSAPTPGVFDAVIVEDDIRFTFTELRQACRGSDTQLRALVDEGILEPQGSGPADWRFPGSALRTARTALRLSGELSLGIDATAVVLDLLAEIESLKSQLRQAGLR